MALSQAVLDHIDKVVASWPPPTPEQVHKVTLILRRAYAEKMGHTVPTYSEPPQVTAKRNAEAKLAKLKSDFVAALDGCHGCGLNRAAHKYQENFGTGFHAYEPLSPDGAIKVARSYKRKIAVAEKTLEEARTA